MKGGSCLFSGLVLVTAGVIQGNTESYDPVANEKATVVSGDARFTVLTPELVRMEWSPAGKFEDRASFVFINRRLCVPDFSVDRGNGGLTIKTHKLTLRYKEGAGPFNKDNLSVTLTLNGRPVNWTPGMADSRNLKGTYRTLDMVSGSVPLPPGLLSRGGWAVIDDSQRLLFDKSDWPWALPRDQKDAIDWYFFGYGHDYTRALRDFTRVAGRIPLPPRYAFGTWWSRYWAYSDDEFKQLVREFREHDVPLDVLVIDMDWHLEGWTGYTWNPKYFPDPAGFLKWVREQGLKVTLNLHPHDGVGKHEDAFADVARHMGLDPDKITKVPFDCGDRRYVEAYFEYLHHPKERQGVNFWWIDWQQGKASSIPGLDPLWWLNYLHWTDMERNPDRNAKMKQPATMRKRPMMFSRWGGLGNHRYQIGFSGDTHCNWPSLAFQPYFTSTAGNVCYPFWSHDIGGHQPGPVEPELYARWIQWGALSPILRTHTTQNPKAERRIWKFPQQVYRVAKQAFHLRYALIPYIYTSARQCYDEAMPLCRPLYYEWPELDEAYKHTNEYLFGDQLLVAPVTKPVSPSNGCAQVNVWLPPGGWTNWFTGETRTGPTNVMLLVPLDEIPLFVRSGGIIPTQPKLSYTGQEPVDPLVLHIWPGQSGKTRVYEDDGETVGYQKGQCAWTPVSHKLIDGVRHITIGPVEGSFPGMRNERKYEIRLRDAWPVRKVTVDGKPLAHTDTPQKPGWSYNANELSVVLRLPKRPVSERAEVVIQPMKAPADAQRLLGGLRGQLAMLDEVSRLLDERGIPRECDPAQIRAELSRYPDTTERTARRAHACSQAYLDAIKNAGLEPDVVRRAVLRLLGLGFAFQAEGAQNGDNELDLSLAVGMFPTAIVVPKVAAEFVASPMPGWTFVGPRKQRWPDLPAGELISLSAKARPTDLPQTTTFRARLSVKTQYASIVLPLEQVLLPSINRWWVAGPFHADFETSLDKVFPPETEIDLQAAYNGKDDRKIAWQKIERSITPETDLTDEFLVDFHKMFGQYHSDAVAYALTYLHAPKDMQATLAVGTDDGMAVWLNGQELHRHHVGRAYVSKEERLPVRLNKGSNVLLMKINQSGGSWLFAAHVETADGQPIPEVTARLKP